MKTVKLEHIRYEAPYNRSQISTNRNCGVIIKAKDSVKIKDVTFTEEACGNTRYNGIEIGLNVGSKVYRPKTIDIEDVNFEGQITNNGILIFDCADNAIINIKNCKFGKCSNPIRFSNYSMSKNVTINIENCECEQWENRQGMEMWKGFLILEDYRNDHTQLSDFAKCFGKESGLTINITNIKANGAKLNPQEYVYNIVGQNTDNRDVQWIIGCIDYSQEYSNDVIPYNEDIYPTINLF